MKIFKVALLCGCVALGAAATGLYAWGGLYSVNTVLHGGPTRWLTMRADDARLPATIRLGLAANPPAAQAGAMSWRQVEPGLEVAELPVLVAGQEVDRILLTRIEPKSFHFVLQNDAAGRHDLVGWLEALQPSFLINGSYFAHNGMPDTPFLSDGRLVSQRDSPAAQGAFLVGADGVAKLEALTNGAWRPAFATARQALATYPLLIGPDGADMAIQESHWVANRSFVGQDEEGRLIFGTTEGAFFSLARFARFLSAAPLGLRLALNLDGGPVACQAVVAAGYDRRFCGEWEIRDDNGWFKVLKMPAGRWIPLPVIVAAFHN